MRRAPRALSVPFKTSLCRRLQGLAAEEVRALAVTRHALSCAELTVHGLGHRRPRREALALRQLQTRRQVRRGGPTQSCMVRRLGGCSLVQHDLDSPAVPVRSRAGVQVAVVARGAGTCLHPPVSHTSHRD